MANALIRGFDKQNFYRLSVELIVSTNLPSKFVGNGVFRKIMEYLNPSVRLRRAIPNDITIRRTIYQQYYKYRQTVIDLLYRSSGQIHIFFNGWTSPNQAALYGIVCFFRNEQNQVQKLLLGVPQTSRHFGSSIAAEALDILHMFQIKEQVGYFTLDNAENNTIAMEMIDDELGFDRLMRRGRCIGHIVNLAAKALLFGKDLDAFEEQLDGQSPLTTAE
jgi:hypothetical protein